MEPYADAAQLLAKLREAFPEHQISKLPKESKAQSDARKTDRNKGVNCKVCGSWHHRDAVHIDYVGHAALTDRLLDVDPLWFWEPMALDADGLPKFDKDGGLWINLTVCGVQRPGYGHAGEKRGGDAIKEIIGDALRNAAMRFGAALDLWHKGELHPDEEADGQAKKPDPENSDKPRTPAPSAEWDIGANEAFEILVDRAYSAFKLGGKPDKFDPWREKWRARKSEPSDKVLVELETFVTTLEDAAAKSAAAASEPAA